MCTYGVQQMHFVTEKCIMSSGFPVNHSLLLGSEVRIRNRVKCLWQFPVLFDFFLTGGRGVSFWDRRHSVLTLVLLGYCSVVVCILLFFSWVALSRLLQFVLCIMFFTEPPSWTSTSVPQFLSKNKNKKWRVLRTVHQT